MKLRYQIVLSGGLVTVPRTFASDSRNVKQHMINHGADYGEARKISDDRIVSIARRYADDGKIHYQLVG